MKTLLNALKKLDRAMFHDVHNREFAALQNESKRGWDAWFSWADGELAELRRRESAQPVRTISF